MSENQHLQALQYLAWLFAQNAADSWPIKSAVENCMEEFEDQYTETEYEKAEKWEFGVHTRVIVQATMVYEHLYSLGYDPVELAEQKQDQVHKTTELNWEWLSYSTLPEEYIQQAQAE